MAKIHNGSIVVPNNILELLTQIIIRQEESYLGLGRIVMIIVETGYWQDSSTASLACETFS